MFNEKTDYEKIYDYVEITIGKLVLSFGICKAKNGLAKKFFEFESGESRLVN